jgi:hypothetical protein
VTLRVEDTDFPCHRVVLASCSSYFKAMFSTNLLESQQHWVNMKEIEADTMQLLIDYAYTSEIVITTSNVQSVSSAANLLEIVPIRDACCVFLEKNMDQSNCIGIYCLAEALSCFDLEQKSRDFIKRHFTEVAKQEEIVRLPHDLLIELISDDNLNVGSEELVFTSILRWYHYDENTRRHQFPDVLEHVRLPLLSPAFIHDHVQSEDVIKESDKCTNLVNEARKYHALHASRLELLCTYRQPRMSSGRTWISNEIADIYVVIVS